MKNIISYTLIAGLIMLSLVVSCNQKSGDKVKSEIPQTEKKVTAQDILGNPAYPAMSYGGYRHDTRDIQPTIKELKDDMRILHAMGIRLLRTYNVHLAQASNLLKAIGELKEEDEDFEMYVMLGAWIDCHNAFTEHPEHEYEDTLANEIEINRAVALANQHPDIVKIIAVGNEAMVRWATSYFVRPAVILKWVNHLQDLKKKGELPADLWITSSDDFASWGGGDRSYRVPELEELIAAVDFVSMHTYPYHNTHYNPDFWGVQADELDLPKKESVALAVERAVAFAQSQYAEVSEYVDSLGLGKSIHIGETGWATVSNGHYGPNGSMASDEYKEALYYDAMRVWTREAGISCFYFEAFDEPWKDHHNHHGSENHFGLFKVDGRAKYALWDLVDGGVFDGLTRNGNPIVKTYDGDEEALLEEVDLPPVKAEILMVK